MAASAEFLPEQGVAGGPDRWAPVCGHLAGVSPLLGVGAALGLGFVALLMSDLAVGVIVAGRWVSLLEEVLP
jgi:hypothetical protein